MDLSPADHSYFHIYRSSAGSGKTYTLTREYLALALRDPEAFRGILAVTFTNKATQEMKDRILRELNDLQEGKSPMAAELAAETGMSEEVIGMRARLVLQQVLHHYTWFSISTIDSFFQKIIRSFAKEVGMQGSFRIELDQNKVLGEVIDALLLEVGDNKELADWVVRFSQDRVEEARSWDVRGDMFKLGSELFREEVRQRAGDMAENTGHQGFIRDFQQKLQKIVAIYEQQMAAFSRKANQVKERYNLTTDDFAYGKSGVAGYLDKLADSKADYSPGKRTLDALDDPGKWASKSSKKREEIITCVESGLLDVLQSVVGLYQREHTRYNSALHVLKNLYTFGILRDIARHLQDYKDENDLMLISDSTQFLHGIIGGNDAPFVYEKTGSRYQHFLIDEFQDTSSMQWQNFKPLVENSLASAQRNLVVGDVKQSIYRWRGGDWRLLLTEVQEGIDPGMTEVKNLAVNWRSRYEVIAFNNSLFAAAAPMLAALFADAVQEIEDEAQAQWLAAQTEQFKQAYEEVAQAFPGQKNPLPPGYVQIDLLEAEEDEKDADLRQRIVEGLPAQIEDMQERGIALRDIAILVRRKSEGRLIADYLMEYQGSPEAKPGMRYDVVSNESLYLGQAPVIRLLIHALRYLINPADGIARVGIATELHRYIRQEEPPLAALFHEVAHFDEADEGSTTDWLPEELRKRRAWLSKQPLFEVVENLIALFGLEGKPQEFAYLQAFQDLILNYIQQESTDLISFLEWWDEKGKTESIKIPEAMDAIRIMTIHKSKGLQFKVVLVPFCTWNFDHDATNDNILWTRSAEEPFAEAGYFPLIYRTDLQKTLFRIDYWQERMRAAMDNLNLLYVALTRAEKELRITGLYQKKDSGLVRNASDLLQRIISETADAGVGEDLPQVALAEHWDEDSRRFSYGSPISGQKEEVSKPEQLKNYAAHNWRSKLSIRPRGDNFFSEVEGGVSDQVNYSKLLHELLASISYLEEVDEQITRFRFEGRLDEEDEPRVRELLEEMMQQERIAAWFADDWEVKTEVPILPKTGELRRPDRVLIGKDRSIVIDFKLGEPRKSHTRQVKEYMQLLSQMGYPAVEGHLLYLDTLKTERIS